MEIINGGIFNDTSISYNKLLEDGLTFLSKKDDWSKWKDLFEGSEGKIILEFLASKTAYEVIKMLYYWQENQLQYVSKRDSAIAVAQNYSYSAGRGTNKTVTITVVPNVETPIYLPEFSVVGDCGDYDLILAEGVTFEKDVPVQITCYIGNLNEQELNVPSEDLYTFRFTNSKISDVYKLYLNEDEVTTTSDMLDMLNDNYFVISNALGGVDVIYLNSRPNFTQKYKTDDILKIIYIEFAEVNYTTVDLLFDYGDIASFDSQTLTTSVEDTKSIQVNAPLFAWTQNRIVSREDFPDKMRQLHPEILDTKGHDLNYPIVEVSYVMTDKVLLSGQTLANVEDTLSKLRTYGIPMTYIVAPAYLSIPIVATVYLEDNIPATFEPKDVVRQAFALHEYKLGEGLDLNSVKRDVMNNNYIKNIQLSLSSVNWSSSGDILLGTPYKPTNYEGKSYIARRFLYYTGAEEPNWPTEIGETVIDGDLILECQKIRGTYSTPWLPNMEVGLHEYVRPKITYQFTPPVLKTQNGHILTKTNTDLYDAIDDKTYKYNVLTNMYEDTLDKYIVINNVLTPVTIDEYFNIVVNDAIEYTYDNTDLRYVKDSVKYVLECGRLRKESDTNQPEGELQVVDDSYYMYQVIGFVNKSGSEEPAPEEYSIGDVIKDGAIQWLVIERSTIADTWTANTMYTEGDIVNVEALQDVSLQMIGVVKKFSTTEPEWPDDVEYFVDNGVEYRVFDDENDNILQTDWNAYFTFAETITIGG